MGDKPEQRIAASPPEGLEAQRVRALRRYRLLDTAPEPQFDDIAHLAAEVCAAPTAMVTLVDEKRQWFKARFNLPLRETPRNIAFCNYAIREPQHPLVVPNALTDPRFADNPLVLGSPGIRFYAGMAVVTPDGQPIGSVAVLDYAPRDGLSEAQGEALRALARQVTGQLRLIDTVAALRLFRAAADQAHDAIVIGEFEQPLGDFRIIYVNDAFERMTGYTEEEVRGLTPHFLLGENADETIAQMVAEIRQRGTISFDTVNFRKDGEAFLADVSIAPIFEEDGTTTHWVSVRRDVTDQRKLMREIERSRVIEETNARLEEEIQERERAEASLAFVSMHDTLTGLPNRSLLLDRVGLALNVAKAEGCTDYCVFYVDLDRFKIVNDSLGHKKGDELLIRLAERLRTRISASDTLSRFSDEFVLLMTEECAEDFAQALLKTIAEPFEIDGQPVQMTSSIGIATVDPAVYSMPEEVVRDAEVAMYRAKQDKRGSYVRFVPALRDEMMSRLRAETTTREALDHGGFRIVYQPIVDAQRGTVVGAEALVRIDDPQLGLIGPDRFIAAAEENGLIVPLGRWVLSEVARAVRRWRGSGNGAPRVHVNVSAVEIAQPDFLSNAMDLLRTVDIPANALCFELTESTLMSNFHVAMETLSVLRDAGAGVSVDDFGTGYSSLSYVRRFPISSIKIDRSFVSGDSGEGLSDPAIVELIAALGGALGVDVIAEGVETNRQIDEVRRLKCSQLQGYAIGRPMPEAAFLGIFATALWSPPGSGPTYP
jgi:diguanylate cyclase (GGDEF)-like protein/PAS domain S-box-containing protein